MAPDVSKHIEIKNGMPIRAFLTEFKKVSDARLLSKITRQEITMRSEISSELKRALSKLNLLH